MNCRILPIIILTLLNAGYSSAAEPAPKFEPHLLMIDANEGIACGDIDGDGKKDLVAGRNWYRGGDWAPRPLRVIEDWNGYIQSNGDYLWDVNGDGRLDVIAGSFVPSEVHWYENPGSEGLRLGKLWPQHLLVDTKLSQNEGQMMEDIDGDGRPEWVVNSWNKKNPTVLWRLVEKEPSAAATPVGKGKDAKPVAGGAVYDLKAHELGADINGHGMAVGDLNGDGLKDVLVGLGWYEQPKEGPWSGPWKFHANWELHSSIPMIVVDLDKDGDSDLIFGNGHDYGLLWWENTGAGDDGNIEFTEHKIDDSYSQPHTLAWADLDGDGSAELITGKRYYAHNGKDPGGMEMPCLYYYKWNDKTGEFTRRTIDEGHVGCGLQLVVEDIDGDEKVDIAVSGKSGTYLLLAK